MIGFPGGLLTLIQDKMVAAEINALMLEIGGLLNESLASVKRRCSAAEFDGYQIACDTVLMDILMEIVTPLEAAHPELLASESGESTVVKHPPRGGEDDRRGEGEREAPSIDEAAMRRANMKLIPGGKSSEK
jgi:hypothetical protein